MKTVLTKEGKYLRLNAKEAEHEVKMGRAKYASKIDWKKTIRNVTKSETVTEAEQKGEQTKSKKAIKAAKFKAKPCQ